MYISHGVTQHGAARFAQWSDVLLDLLTHPHKDVRATLLKLLVAMLRSDGPLSKTLLHALIEAVAADHNSFAKNVLLSLVADDSNILFPVKH